MGAGAVLKNNLTLLGKKCIFILTPGSHYNKDEYCNIIFFRCIPARPDDVLGRFGFAHNRNVQPGWLGENLDRQRSVIALLWIQSEPNLCLHHRLDEQVSPLPIGWSRNEAELETIWCSYRTRFHAWFIHCKGLCLSHETILRGW